MYLSISSEVQPEFREYERLSTTVLNAYLQPVIDRYLGDFQQGVSEAAPKAALGINQSSGGLMSVARARHMPIRTALSGPAAGAVGAIHMARLSGLPDVISLDMGGTSADVALMRNYTAGTTFNKWIEGYPARLASMDINAVGAGGGSIAWFDRDGLLKVGPASAGAVPGPACYGKGGTEPTATDADLVLGVLAEDNGGLRLDPAAARAAIEEHIARPLEMDVTTAAWGIRQVLDSRMADLLRSVTVEKGHDPREFVLFAGGGQGPSHAWALCRELGIAAFVVTPTATVQSAYGTGTSDLKRTAQRPHYLRLASADAVPEAATERLAGDLAAITAQVGDLAGAGATVRQSVAVRYRGQAHHLDVPVDDGLSSTAALDKTLRRFEEQYEALFGAGAAFREAGFELLGLRAIAQRPVGRPISPHPADQVLLAGSRRVVFDDPASPVDCPVYTTGFPAPGQSVRGPCLVVFPGQTLVVPEGGTATTDELGNCVVRLA
jgi:N-methylhydantoinase A